GYATFSASSSASVEWTVSVPTAKTYSVVIRFANGSGTSMTGKMNANGGSYTSFSLGTTASWSTWTTKAVNVRLNAGTNRVRLAAGSSRGLPNVDRLDVNDGATTPTYALTIAVNGNGSTTPTVGGHSYAAGTVVSVTAIPASGATFTGWSGAASGTANPVTITMDAAKSLTANFSGGVTNYTLSIGVSGSGSTTPAAGTYTYPSGTTVTVTAQPAAGATFTGWNGACVGTGSCVVTMTANRTVTASFSGGTQPTGGLVGWATVGGTVTGGGNATPITVSDLSALNGAAGGTNPAVIRVSGTISGNVTIGSNKTIEGVNASATIRGSIRMSGSANVILRNLNVIGYNCSDNSDCQSGSDAIGVQNGAHHLWFDHLAISDGSDGNLDFTHAADNITVSWCKFFYTGRPGGHQFSNLIGHSDGNASEDTGHLRITFHHNWWADGVGERMPRVRFGQVHVYNNLYTASGNNYCVAPGAGASVLVENNAFIGVNDPIDLTYGDGAATVRGNLFTNVSGNVTGRGTAFTPPYAYTLDAASSVEALVRANAGPR
ncbi:MAG TPA: carbohydrate-binding protein, partial [Thermoanaerobaculia bacterium]|nr:carbohydrate-binding protein [Thermoanaerobaculia bacterium]